MPAEQKKGELHAHWHRTPLAFVARSQSILLHVVMQHAILSHLLIARSRLAVIGIRPDADAAARRKEARHFDVLGLHEPHEVLHDNVDTVLVKVAVIAEGEEIELEALALHHTFRRYVTDAYLGKVGLASDRTEAGELGTIETHPVIVLRVFVLEGLQHLGSIILPILCLSSKGSKSLLFSCTHYYIII